MDNSISVIICVYTEERWNQIIAAIQSVKSQTYQPQEIIVVVDHNQQLENKLSQIEGIIVTKNTQEQGLSGARNSGVAITRGNIIVFLDDDAAADSFWLEKLIVVFDDPSVIGAGGNIIPNWDHKEPSWFPTEFQWVVGCSYRGMPTSIKPIRNPIGGNMAFRRSVFDKIGGFRIGIGRIGVTPLGCEETEWCIRAIEAFPSSVVLYIPDACTYHFIPIQRETWQYFLRRCYAEGLSKAKIACYVKVSASLSSETQYILRTLPTGIIRVIRNSFIHHDIRFLSQIVAIICGLFATVYGYFIGKMHYHDFSGIRP
jgi:glycosyltransferase involved in cell wall biosynthesis